LNASGVADGQYPPTIWYGAGGRNIRWKAPIPGLGHSCPILWGNRIFLTTAVSGTVTASLKTGIYGNVDSVEDASADTFDVLCLDKATGKVLTRGCRRSSGMRRGRTPIPPALQTVSTWLPASAPKGSIAMTSPGG